jgi:hypothetical protein
MKFKMGNFISLSRRVCAQILARRPPANFIARSTVNSSSFTADARTQHATFFSHSRQMMFYVSPSKFVPSAADTKNLQIEMRLSTQCICAHCDFNAFGPVTFIIIAI